MKKITIITILFLMTQSFVVFAQKEIDYDAFMEIPALKENSAFFKINVTVKGKTDLDAAILNLAVKLKDNHKTVSAFIYDSEGLEKVQSFDPDSEFVLMYLLPLDKAEGLKIGRYFKDIFNESEKFLRDSIRYYESKPKVVSRKKRKSSLVRLRFKLSDLLESNRIQGEYLEALLKEKVNKNSYVVYNADIYDKYKLIRKIKKTATK